MSITTVLLAGASRSRSGMGSAIPFSILPCLLMGWKSTSVADVASNVIRSMADWLASRTWFLLSAKNEWIRPVSALLHGPVTPSGLGPPAHLLDCRPTSS